MQVITAKLPKTLVKELDILSRSEQIDRSTAIRKLLAKGTKEWKVDAAVESYSSGLLSTEQAAGAAGVSVWEFYDILQQRQTPSRLDLDDFAQELAAVRTWKQ